MSSDPFADLASSAEAFAKKFREFMTRSPRPAAGSPADEEAQGEPFAGDWSDHPSSDIFATTYLAATSRTDHLLGLADVLSSRNALFAAYTLTRGAVEAAAIGCHLTDQDIDGRERVRRTMNYRLDAMCERVWLFKDMHGDYAAEKLEETKQRISDFARSAPPVRPRSQSQQRLKSLQARCRRSALRPNAAPSAAAATTSTSTSTSTATPAAAGEDDAAEVGGGVLVVAGGDGPPLLEAAEAALDGVAVAVDLGVEGGRAPAGQASYAARHTPAMPSAPTLGPVDPAS